MNKSKNVLKNFNQNNLHFDWIGKQCSKTRRQHETRCNMYYECINIHPNKHLWKSRQCEEGLIFEQSIELCVLPGKQ